MRQRYGQEFADKLLFYVFQRWQPATTSEKNNFNAYFMSRLFSGVFAVANDYDKYEVEISAILKARGLDSEQLPF